MFSWAKSPAWAKAIGRVGSIVLWFVLKSIRWKVIDNGGLEAVRGQDQAVIFVNWHCRLLAIPAMLGRRYPTAYIISESYDGQLISRTVAPFGIETIWGSRSKAALTGYREMRRRLKGGGHVGITPDGPRGPARMAAMGAIALARTSGATVIPLAWSTHRIKRLNTWDRLAIPGFFSQGVQLWGEPVQLPLEATPEAEEKARLCLEDALNTLTAEADAYFGHPADHGENKYGIRRPKR